MAYQRHVSRAPFFAENAGQRIGIDEWPAAVQADPALMLDQGADDYALVVSAETAVGERIVRDDGNLVCSYPSEQTYAKLLELAQRLNAQVQGDDGERYLALADYPGPVPVDRPPSPGAGVSLSYIQRDRAWRWLGIALAVATVLAANFFDWW